MPAHPKKSCSSEKKHPGGLLKRNGTQAELWYSLIGYSTDAIPGNQLPLVKMILQCYRGLWIKQPAETTTELAKVIADEVIDIWVRVRVPIMAIEELHKNNLTGN